MKELGLKEVLNRGELKSRNEKFGYFVFNVVIGERTIVEVS